ncbi:hypothetical protein INT43_002728 [Umbelopsis isabellina]|uniref:Metallo-beta-lactamase domain-containing protein n=1 Tax=Mortierella isabellina TaxID=91625 RepID=A0A8H7UKA7_MORIS|nr:hypothetical protein INT43_002728 [Umbelopsis isabellina]
MSNITIPTKEPTASTKSFNRVAASKLPFHDKADFENAQRGFIGTISSGKIARSKGPSRPDGPQIFAWDLNEYNFVNSNEAPDTVNASLWRQAQLNCINGLFKVTDRVYQVRGFDLSNMTIIQGETGLIIIDPLTTVETSKAALDLYYAHFPFQPIVSVMITHSHIDHFGGIRGIVDEADVRSGKISIISPEGFLEHAISENIFAGNAMRRRAQYMYGVFLPRGEKGQVDAGLGKAVPKGSNSLIAPTEFVSKTGETRRIDGVDFEFQMANATEAPCEMIIYLPQLRALCAAEVMTHNMHNLYTLRGAEIRDAVQWWKTINETIEIYNDKATVIFAQHHWPIWGQQEIHKFLSKQRDLYKYMHDQTLRLMNHGFQSLDIAELVQLPSELENEWYNRGYYGSVSHNVRGIYQKYLGYYSSNPAELNPLPPVAAAKKYVQFMGGAENVLKLARQSFEEGDYRWVAQVVNHVIFAEPTNKAALNLQADAFEQLGYQAECSTWRNEYLVAAQELRFGVFDVAVGTDDDILRSLTIDMSLDYLGIRLNGPRAQGVHAVINLQFLEKESAEPSEYVLRLENCALTYSSGRLDRAAHATIQLTRPIFTAIAFGQGKIQDLIKNNQIKVTGDVSKMELILSLMENFTQQFPIVTPNAVLSVRSPHI